MAWLSDSISSFEWDVITHPCPTLNSGLINNCVDFQLSINKCTCKFVLPNLSPHKTSSHGSKMMIACLIRDGRWCCLIHVSARKDHCLECWLPVTLDSIFATFLLLSVIVMSHGRHSVLSHRQFDCFVVVAFQQLDQVNTKRNINVSIYWFIMRGNVSSTGGFLYHKERVKQRVCPCHDIIIIYTASISTRHNFHDIHYIPSSCGPISKKKTPPSDCCVLCLNNIT